MIDAGSRGALTISYELTGTGWAAARIDDGAATATITASYLSDALRGLVEAVALLLEGVETTRCSWDEEPGEYGWVFRRVGTDVDLTVLAFPELWGGQPDERGEVVFHSIRPAEAVGRAVLDAANGVLRSMSEEEYLQRWVDHPYPTSAVDRLREALTGLAKVSVDWATVVRRRPLMWFRPLMGDDVGPIDLLVELAWDALFEASYVPSMHVVVEVHDDLIRLVDDGKGISATPHMGKPRLEVLLATLTTPQMPERGSLAHLGALAELLTVRSTTSDVVHSIAVSRGRVVDGPRLDDAAPGVAVPTHPTGTEVEFRPDPDLFSRPYFPSPLPDVNALLVERVGSLRWWKPALLERLTIIDSRP